MYRFLLTRQWVALTLLALVLIPTMVELGFWQLGRHEDKVAHNELIEESLAAPPVEVDELTAPGREPRERDQFRPVTATGRYDTAGELVVRQRTAADERTIGYYVLTPLVRRDGSAVLVNRGWIEAGGDLTTFPDIPAAPRGEVTVTGLMMADETTAKSGIKEKPGLPERQVMLIDGAHVEDAVDGPVLGGYLQLASSSPEEPAGHPERVPEPEPDGTGLNLAYAVQWWLFAVGVPVGWVILVRRELRDRAAAAASPDERQPAVPA